MTGQETLKKFDELYYQTYSKILKYIICNCHNIDDVKDIVQNVYIDVFKKLKKDTSINETYIYGIAKHKIKDYYRLNFKVKILSLFQEKNENDVNLIDTIKSNINIEKEVITKEDLKDIWKFLKKKKLIVQKIFYFYYYENMNIKNVSKTLNISEANVKNYLYRTLKELYTFMKNRGDENV